VTGKSKQRLIDSLSVSGKCQIIVLIISLFDSVQSFDTERYRSMH